MASIVLFEKDEAKYNCAKCMDGQNWKAQGRDEEYIKNRIKRRLLAKGCLKDAKAEVLRLNDGKRIYRCPRSIVDGSGALSHFEEVSEIMEGQRTFDPNSKPWKWHSIRRRVQNEILQVRKLAARNARDKAGG